MTRARSRLPRPVLCLITVVVLALSAACGSSPTAPPPPDLSIQCPASFNVMSNTGQPVTVTYSGPAVSGGTAPYSVTCTPPSGTALAVGTHEVTCQALDVAARSASCSFSVHVEKAPQLGAARFLAFGDSLTVGVLRETLYEMLWDLPNSYPSKLQGFLRARYALQMPIVLNDGVGGERVVGRSPHSPLGGVGRLPLSLDDNEPDVLLLMEGTNDIASGAAAMRRAWDGLEEMVREARRRGVKVFLATIPPQRPNGRNAETIALIPEYNNGIRRIAPREGARLVDVFAAMKDKLYLIGGDDLHLTIEGYEYVAGVFYDAIVEDLDIP